MADNLQLGDVIKIIAPSDPDIDNHTFLIEYIDSDKIRLEEANGPARVLTMTNGSLDNESITSIVLKSRAEEEGYARQHNLVIGVWLDIHFSGDLPLIITGKITNLEKDKIEITTFPENEVILTLNIKVCLKICRLTAFKLGGHLMSNWVSRSR
jgi:hypothetical protein